MRRFEMPAAPLGWAGQGAELIRIVDPTGRAIAWLAPGFGANCVGYAVRREDDTWRHIFASGKPDDLRRDPLAYGCAILGPEPDAPGSAHHALWQFIERDPTAATCAVRCGSVRLEFNARLEDAALHLDLLASQERSEPTAITLGLHLCLAGEFRWQAAPDNDPTQGATFVDGDAGQGLVIMVRGSAAHQWHIDQLPEGRNALVARGAALPVEQYRFTLVVAAENALTTGDTKAATLIFPPA